MKVLWMDLETSGPSSYKHGIVEASFIVEIKDKVVDRKTFYMNPKNKEINEKSLAISGLKIEDINEFPLPPETYNDIKTFFEAYVDPFEPTDKFVPAGFNVLRFDLPFLRGLWYDNKDKYFHSFFVGGGIELVGVSRYLQWTEAMKRLQNDKLETLAKHLGCYKENQHQAHVDVEMARDCALAMKKLIAGTTA